MWPMLPNGSAASEGEDYPRGKSAAASGMVVSCRRTSAGDRTPPSATMPLNRSKAVVSK